MNDPKLQLQLTRSTPEGDHVFFRQRYNGIPVYGSEIGVHMMGNRVIAVTGDYLPDITTDPTPALTAGQAEAIVLGMLEGRIWDDIQLRSGKIGSATELRYVNTGLNGGPDPATHLTWQVNIKNAETYLVDAITGEIRLENPVAISYDMDLETGSHASPSTWCGAWAFTTADDHLCSENGCNSDGMGDGEAGPTWWNIGNTYWWYRNTLGRDSWDNDNDLIQLYIHVGNDWRNAHFLENGDCIEFGENYARVDDVVTHEFTHGVVHHSSELAYANESGALNESFADVFGELVEGAGVDWVHGDGKPGGVNRSLANPRDYGDPDTYLGEYWRPWVGNPVQDNDWGGVHSNSGVPNKAAYLMIHGGTHNTYTVSSIGMDKGARLMHEAMISLSSSATMMQMRNMVVWYAEVWRDAQSLGFTSQNVCQVRNAYAAVGLPNGDRDCDGQEDNVDADVDGDSVPNGQDNCKIVKNSGQSDVDNDGAGDACDPNDDNDFYPDSADNCPLVWNDAQSDWNGNGVGDACDDWDADGTMDATDNCRDSYNPDQANADNDPTGDACDLDDDNDGHSDITDNCPLHNNPSQSDADNDTVGNACDLCPSVSNPDNGDPDGDGLGNPCDADDDNDAVLDGDDNCPEAPNPEQFDINQDGLGLACDESDQHLLLDVQYDTLYDPGLGGFKIPAPGGCTMCGPDLEMPWDYRQVVTVGLEVPFYAQIVNSDGEVMANSNRSSLGAMGQTLRFKPAPHSITGLSVSSKSQVASPKPGADRMEYFLEVYPSPDAVPGRAYNLSLAFSEIRTGLVYLPLLSR